MLSEFIISLLINIPINILKILRLKKIYSILLNILLHITIFCVFIFGLTSNTNIYRAFLLFVSVYLIINVCTNLLLYFNLLPSYRSRYVKTLSVITTIEELKIRNTNTRIFIYFFGLVFSVTNYYMDKFVNINNVFTTIIIIDVLIDLVLTRYIKKY